MTIERVLIAVDDGPISVRAAERAQEVARAFGAALAFVSVVDPAAFVAPESGVPGPELLEMARRDARGLLESFRERADSRSSPLFVAVGKPAREITRTARDWSADLIVIGTHGRTGLGRMLAGSVAEHVVRHAPCAVLVVRAQESRLQPSA